MPFSQTRFSFTDAEKKSHSLTLVQGDGGQQGAAILDGKWVVLKLYAGEGRAEYRNGGLQFELKSDRWGTDWVLSCAGRESKEIRSDVKLQESVLSRLELGPKNELVEEEGADTVLRRHGWKSHEGTKVKAAGPSERDLHEVAGLQARVVVAPAIVGVNVLIWLLMVVAGVYAEGAGVFPFISWGAQYGPHITRGEPWRLLTATMLHGDWFHLLSNMVALVAVGPFVERLVGSAPFLALYLVSGLFGSLASLYANPGIIGVGASGAIFGVIGALVGLMFRYHVYVRRKDLIKYALLLVLLLVQTGIYLVQSRGVREERIDVAAHGGGLLAGFVCGLILCRPVAPERRTRRALLMGGSGVVAVLGLALLHPKVVDVFEEIRALAKAEKQVLAGLRSAALKAERMQVRRAEAADEIDRDVVPQWIAASDRFREASTRAPALYRDFLKPFNEFASLRLRTINLISEAVRKNDYSILQVAIKQSEEAEALLGQLKGSDPD